ncbi:MAG: crossover junction endodeoxyribonuclease RuvC [Promethearchaeota archaeon]
MILGIDPSLTNLGLIVLSNDGQLHLSEVYKSNKKNDVRLLDLEERIKEIINDYELDLAVMEGYAFSRNYGLLTKIGECHWAIRRNFLVRNISLYIVSPLSLKKWITGSGKGQKATILKEVYKKWKIDFNNDNLADAFGLAKIGEAIYQVKNNIKNLNSFYKYEREVLKLVMKNGEKKENKKE